MLLLDREQVTRQEIMELFAPGMAVKTIEKKPSFEVHSSRKKIDKANGGVMKTPIGHNIRSHFYVKHPQTQLDVEIRYAKSHNPTNVGGSLMDVYEPRYVEFKGATNAFQNDLDLAVYFYLHPTNASSPFSGKNKPKIVYIDTKKRAQEKVSRITALTDALRHVDSLGEGELVILAKGLGLKGIDKMDIDEVKADVMEYAQKFPALYNEKAFTQLTFIEGKILHLIDKGVFKLTTIGTVRRWSWAKGEREGENIVDVHNLASDAKIALKNYIFENMQAGNWLFILNNTATEITSKEAAERYLKSQEQETFNVTKSTDKVVGEDLPEHLRNINPSLNTAPAKAKAEWPTDFKSSLEYLKQYKSDPQPSNKVASDFLKAINAGEVTQEDARQYIKNEYDF